MWGHIGAGSPPTPGTYASQNTTAKLRPLKTRGSSPHHNILPIFNSPAGTSPRGPRGGAPAGWPPSSAGRTRPPPAGRSPSRRGRNTGRLPGLRDMPRPASGAGGAAAAAAEGAEEDADRPAAAAVPAAAAGGGRRASGGSPVPPPSWLLAGLPGPWGGMGWMGAVPFPLLAVRSGGSCCLCVCFLWRGRRGGGGGVVPARISK